MGRVSYTAVRMLYDVFVKEVNRQYKAPRPGDIESWMKQLKSEMDDLLDTWSVMAGRNILADIVRALVALEPVLTGDSKKAAATFKQQVEKAMQGHSPTKARYNSVLCIGYKVKTTYPGGFAGLPDDRQDMEAKCADMKLAIQQARTAVDASKFTDSASMLKIFMAPEFFFRGKNGAYDFDDVNGVGGKKSLVDIMRDEIDKPVYKDWLFVLGTVIVAALDVKTRCTTPGCNAGVEFVKDGSSGKTKPVCKANPAHAVAEKSTGAAIDNVALIVKEKFVHSVKKELISHVDFDARPGVKDKVTVRGVETGVKRYDVPSGYKAAEDRDSKFQDERMGGNVFTVDGVTFGCEVCLDHAATTSSSSDGRLNNAANIQIQLIPSGGMSTSKLRTVENGVVFNVDGDTPHVQALGLSGLDLVNYENSAMESASIPKDWDQAEKYVEGLVGLPKFRRPAPAIGPGLSGSVVQYGPFEIPAV
jgi:hypothetical protein